MTGEAEAGKQDDQAKAGGDAGEAENLVDAAKGSGDQDKAKGNGAAAAASTEGMSFTSDPKAVEQVFGKVGENGRPANVPVKYWDADKKALKADVVFNQLRWAEGKLGKKLEVIGAPPEGTDYEVAVPEEIGVEIPTDDPAVKGFLEIARKHDVSQQFVSEVLEAVAKELGGARQATLADEMKKLGEGGTQRLSEFGQFLDANLTEDQAAAIRGLITSSAAFEAIEALVSKAMPPKFATKEDQAASVNTQAELRAQWERLYFQTNENGERLMSIDPEHRERTDALRDKVFGTARRDASGQVVNG